MKAEAVLEGVLETLRRSCPDLTPKIEQDGNYICLEFTPAPGAAYFFTAYLHTDEYTLELDACLLGAPANALFWNRRYERDDYDSYPAMVAKFSHDLVRVLSHPTRIVQVKGFFFWHFRCEVLSASGSVELPGASTLRPATAPPIRGRRGAYESPALCSATSQLAS